MESTPGLVADLFESLRDQGFQSIETHLSLVFLGPKDVYKFKRPLDLGFVDFSRHSQRRAACEAEVELNRRLAPGVYLGLVYLHRDSAGRPRLSDVPPENDAESYEWGVHMRRLPDEARADLLLQQNKLGPSEIERIAAMLASFHASARCDADTSRFGEPAAIAANVEENFSQVAGTVSSYLNADEFSRITDYQRRFLRDEIPLFEARIRARKVRDGHGDLRLEHLYREPDGHFLAIDCIEFNERFRFGDVCLDLAFLAMDLHMHKRPDLAEKLVLAYARESRDYSLYRLLDFYLSYRSIVRAKVRSILAEDLRATAETRARAKAEAHQHYQLALSLCSARKPPILLALAGGIASGKSSLAEALGHARSLLVLSSDRIRKEQLGQELTTKRHDPVFQGAYRPEATARVYTELFERARDVLTSGRSVILDASFRAKSERARVTELAANLGIEAYFVECYCSRETAQARLAEREEGPSISDGRRAIYDTFQQSFEPLSELPAAQVCRIHTEQPVAESLQQAERFLRGRL